MSLNYTTLQSTVQGYAHRSDLAGMVATFIMLAESRINERVRMRAQRTQTSTTLPANQNWLAIPTGSTEIQDIAYQVTTNTSPIQISYVAPTKFQQEVIIPGGYPASWTVRDKVYFNRPPAADIPVLTLNYLLGFDLANEPLGENALTQTAPQVYINATLAEIYRYLQDEERAGYYGGLAQSDIDALNASERRKEGHHQSILKTDIPSFTRRQYFDIFSGR